MILSIRCDYENGVGHDEGLAWRGFRREKGQGGCEKKIIYAAGGVEAADFRKFGEGRVVDDHAPRRIVMALVVAAGPERTDHLNAVEVADVGRHPGYDCRVDFRRSEAVVGGELRPELVDETLVILVSFTARALLSAPGSVTKEARHCFFTHIFGDNERLLRFLC